MQLINIIDFKEFIQNGKEIKTEYKMIKVNKELHKLLKIESVSSGKSMQNIAEKAIKNYIHILECIE